MRRAGLFYEFYRLPKSGALMLSLSGNAWSLLAKLLDIKEPADG